MISNGSLIKTGKAPKEQDRDNITKELTVKGLWFRGFPVRKDDSYFFNIYSSDGSIRLLKKIDSSYKFFDLFEDNYFIRSNTDCIELHPLDGTSTTTPIKLKNIEGFKKLIKIFINGNNILTYSSYNDDSDCVAIYHLPSIEEVINKNIYLSNRQKKRLVKKLQK